MAEWHFDEGSGNIAKDTSGNGNDGVIHGATWVYGKFGKALRFDGVDDYVEVPDSPGLDITDAITIEAWVKPLTLTSNTYPMWKVNTYGLGYGILIIGGASDKYQFAFHDGGSWQYVNTATSPTIGNWYHIVGTFDGLNIRIYVNGALENTASYSGGINPTTNTLVIGSGSPTVGHFNCIIDEVRIYNRALSAEEIKAHYERGQTALTLTKTASPHSIKPGQTTTITITIKNTGTTEIKDIEVADTIPADLNFVGGETSKKYASLKPKDSREFQYILLPKEAGTFNLDPATATYADEKGNYYTAKSNNAKIEVIPSLITTPQITITPTSVIPTTQKTPEFTVFMALIVLLTIFLLRMKKW
ncbi:MAG: LamG-like jellyroll fold domain-containing protein [Methanosarcinales archaeon]